MSKSTKKLRKLIPAEEAFARWEKNPKFRAAYEELRRSSPWWLKFSGRVPPPASPRSSLPSG